MSVCILPVRNETACRCPTCGIVHMDDADVQLIKRSTDKQYDAHLLSTDCIVMHFIQCFNSRLRRFSACRELIIQTDSRTNLHSFAKLFDQVFEQNRL